ncbi:hypothetical protein RRF57_007136 [Xylaria bambusicola]|uniref:Uncharacterized protein n=1 Tax=Xylaria bambusicola TaxID=326684 RepID=A0AAN7UMA3_9PEZI
MAVVDSGIWTSTTAGIAVNWAVDGNHAMIRQVLEMFFEKDKCQNQAVLREVFMAILSKVAVKKSCSRQFRFSTVGGWLTMEMRMVGTVCMYSAMENHYSEY